LRWALPIRADTVGLLFISRKQGRSRGGEIMPDRTYIALLRGINVGGKVLKMADLKEAVAKLDFADVETYLQSGNMVFRAPTASNAVLASGISDAIRAHKSMDVTVMVREAAEWARIVAGNPFPQAAEFPKSVHTFILDEMPEPSRLETLRAREAGREEWQIVDGTLYLHTPDGFGKSVLGGIVERILKVPMTARNWNTVLALAELAGPS
jgi:uncharacterized protein (DUF1697 family)